MTPVISDEDIEVGSRGWLKEIIKLIYIVTYQCKAVNRVQVNVWVNGKSQAGKRFGEKKRERAGMREATEYNRSSPPNKEKKTLGLTLIRNRSFLLSFLVVIFCFRWGAENVKDASESPYRYTSKTHLRKVTYRKRQLKCAVPRHAQWLHEVQKSRRRLTIHPAGNYEHVFIRQLLVECIEFL